jgi:hypothetical protein
MQYSCYTLDRHKNTHAQHFLTHITLSLTQKAHINRTNLFEQCESLESLHWERVKRLQWFLIFQSLPARKHEVVRNSVSKVAPQGWSLMTMMLYRLAVTICTMQNLQYVRCFVRKQYYLHTVVRMDKCRNSLRCNAFQTSHDVNKKVLWRFLPFQLEWIKVDLVVFWHADANSQPQSVIREGRHGAIDILTWNPGRVKVDFHSC